MNALKILRPKEGLLLTKKDKPYVSQRHKGKKIKERNIKQKIKQGNKSKWKD